MKIALITGTDRGLGLELGKQLSALGVKVIMGALKLADSPRIEGTVPVQLDVTKPEQIKEVRAFIAAEYGKLDILINNAGVLTDIGVQPSEVTDSQLQVNFAVNFFGPWKLSQSLLPLLKKGKEANIINMATQVATFAQLSDPDSPLKEDICPAYQSSKIALNALTVLFAKEYTEYGISTNSVCPGWVLTDMGHEDLPDYGDAVRPLTPEEACRPIVELALNPKGNGTFTSGGETVAW